MSDSLKETAAAVNQALAGLKRQIAGEKMQTIPCNRTAKLFPQIKSVKCFSLSNHFNGEPVEPAKFAEYMDRMATCKPKVRLDKETGSGQIRFHSNEWYEFTI